MNSPFLKMAVLLSVLYSLVVLWGCDGDNNTESEQSDTDTDSDSDGDSDTNSDSDSDTDTDTDSDSDGDSDTDSDSDSDTDTDTDSDCSNITFGNGFTVGQPVANWTQTGYVDADNDGTVEPEEVTFDLCDVHNDGWEAIILLIGDTL